jgi:hypothetical protein
MLQLQRLYSNERDEMMINNGKQAYVKDFGEISGGTEEDRNYDNQ